MFLQSIFLSVISVSYYRLLVEIMLSSIAIDAVAIDATTTTNTTTATNTVAVTLPPVKKVKKVRVPETAPTLEATTVIESGPESQPAVALVAAAPEKKQKVKKTAGETDAIKKKKGVVKKPQEKEAAAVTEVVQMVADMKTAFTDATDAKEVKFVTATVAVEDATVVVEDADTDTNTDTNTDTDTELVLDAYIASPLEFEPLVELELGGDDSIVNFEELRLDGDETPCCNPIPEPNQEDEPVSVVDTVAHAVDTVTARPVRPVFRFEFSNECFKLLNGFARDNLGVPRKEYKAKWEQFATAHAEFIAQESARLADAGYDGDVLVKMFKTVKYYLTKRVKKDKDFVVVVDEAADEALGHHDDATVDAEDAGQDPVQQEKTQTRRHYTTLDRAVLEAMDSHITSSISSNSKPATCYASFCDQFRNSIETEIARLVRYDAVGTDAFTFTEKTAEEKLKKTYKNRMFLHIRNM